MTPDEAKHQARFLARQAQEHGAAWPRLSSQRYAGEQLVRTAYSTYRVIDGRCIVVQRLNRTGFANEGSTVFVDDESHECLGLHLVGYLNRHDEPAGIRWSLHASPRPDAKAVFWRATQTGTGHFVVTSRLAPSVVPPAATTGSVAAVRGTPPPLPKRPGPPKVTVDTPTAGVALPVAARPPAPPVRKSEAQFRGAPPKRAGTAVIRTPAPPPPRCMKP